MTYVTPQHPLAAFTCPHCESHTGQHWVGPTYTQHSNRSIAVFFSVCHALNCKNAAIWVADVPPDQPVENAKAVTLVWPPIRKGPEPNTDLSSDIQKDYQEARVVFDASPRAAAALLRLALQKLMVQLGQGGKRINDDIAALVSDGLSPKIQRAADIVRVTGNDAVHPGQIDTDDPDTVIRLFGLINLIAHDRITQPAEIDAMYTDLPQQKLDGIEKRDATT